MCSPPGLASHPAGGLWLRRAWTDGVVERGSWKHTQPFEEPKTKMGKRKTQAGMGQKEQDYASCHRNLARSTEGQAGPWASDTSHLQVEMPHRNVSFEFERIAEARELSHLVGQITRVVIISLAQRRLQKGEVALISAHASSLGWEPQRRATCACKRATFSCRVQNTLLTASRQPRSIYGPAPSSLLVASGTAAHVLSLRLQL